MARVMWDIPDPDLPRWEAALADTYGYKPFIDDGVPNPEPKADFVHRMVGEDWRRRIVQYERRVAQEAVPVPGEPDIRKVK